ncbi:MAG: hypothetical protein WDW38_001183 [Sanguina aurantia]
MNGIFGFGPRPAETTSPVSYSPPGSTEAGLLTVAVSRDGISMAVAGDAQPITGLPSVAAHKIQLRGRPRKTPNSTPASATTAESASAPFAAAQEPAASSHSSTESQAAHAQHPTSRASGQDEGDGLFADDCVSGFKIAARGPMGPSPHQRRQQQQQQGDCPDKGEDSGDEHSDFGDDEPSQRAHQSREAGPTNEGRQEAEPAEDTSEEGRSNAKAGEEEREGGGGGGGGSDDDSYDGEEGGSEDDGQRMGGGKHHGGPDEGPMRAPIFIFSLIE